MATQADIPPVFVEGLDVSAYGITRSVGRHGVPVYALNDHQRDPLRHSRYCRGCFIFADDPTQPRAYAGDSVANEDVLCRQMLEWGTRFQQKPVLFATSDWFARFLSHRQQELAQKFLFHWVAPELFSTIVDKGSMARFCERGGVKVPRTHITRPEDDMAQVARDFVYPCLVKPIHRYTVGFPVESAKVLIAQTPAEAQEFFARYPQMKGAVLMQTSGFATLANVLASLAIPYQIPLIMFVSERGTLGEFNYGQSLVCRTMRPVLDSLAMEHHTATRLDEFEFIVDRSIKQAITTQAPVALILSPLLTGGKVFDK